MGTIGGDELSRCERTEEGGDSSIGGEGGGGTDRKEERILVSVRLRPLNEKEIMNRDSCDWECINETTIIFKNNLPERSMYPTAYNFDRVFGSDSTTRQVYEEGAKEVALSVVSGINSSIFAYGQTSSGKTYTMSGITEYAVADIYDYIQRHDERAFVMKFSAMEIYNEAVRDLLSSENTPLRLLDDPERGTIVEKLTEETLRDWDHLKELLSICEAQRQIGETSLNETSSRSHQIIRLTIESSAHEFLGKDNSSTLAASVNFIDLAGSERASQAMSAGARLKEGCHINRSLLTLGTVIRKLSKGRNGHIPYRDSKLTRILHLSLGGNARTAIICTMSPAHGHIEQSRNTLLFASCAKEVVTNAQVNVVMSDKALVKHLQRELARLESELRYPGQSSSISHAEVLLKEKDNQIRKMEKEIKELMWQRDLAQSRLEDLLQSMGSDQASVHWGIHQPAISPITHTCEDVRSISESSSVSYHGLDFSFRKVSASPDSVNDSDIFSENDLQNFETQSGKNISSLHLHISSSPSFAGEDITQDNSQEFEDLCKDVQCIEVDETSTSRSNTLLTKSNGPLPPSDDVSYVEQSFVPNLISDPEVTVCSLEQQLLNARKTSVSPAELHADREPSSWPSERALLNSRSSVLSRSRSCKPSLFDGSPSPWFQGEDQSESTPPSMRLVNDFPRRPVGLSRRACRLHYGAENEILSGEGSQSSGSRSSTDVLERKRLKTASEEDIASFCDFVAGMKQMAQIQYRKQHSDVQDHDQKVHEDLAVEKIMKDVGMAPMLYPAKSPSISPSEFEKQQEEIFLLWHECNVSLVHRTYFFLLFKGDPSDIIYMEVELRRLSFLKRTFNEGHVYDPVVVDGHTVTLASSIKALRREREMLYRKMQKKLSPEERNSLYREWGIALDSKQRRLQLASILWSDPYDRDHIRESASIVANLVGLLKPGHALKEMFGLSFTPQKNNRRSYSWRH